MTYKESLSIVAIALTFIAFYPYIRSIMQGKIKPHLFSWVIWGSTTFIVFLAQLEDNYFTSDPLWAVVILTTVDVFGFGPTLRKAYVYPFEEQLTFFALFAARNVIVIAALENYSLTTVLFPAVIATACLLLMLMVTYRRRALAI
ncbi:MAG: hypothetical protein HY036_03845 [Nitrospirae bacterium]|nr:hypothetical protein [Nitrospirota bacterium]